MENNKVIPKKIHYIWLGGNPMPKIFYKCFKSWQKYCPDYEIVKHDESNLNIDIVKFSREAYDAKKYAFASDVLRYDILFREGGIYLDIDVELIKGLDAFLNDGLFLGFENNLVNPGLIMGATPHNKIVEELFNQYKTRKFICEDGSYNLTTIGTYATDYLQTKGLIPNNTTQKYSDFCVYSSDYFNPCDYHGVIVNKTVNTHGIHYFAGTWKKKKNFFQRLFGKIEKRIKQLIYRRNNGK